MDSTKRLPLCHNFLEDLRTKATVILYSNGNSKNLLSSYTLPLINYGSNTCGTTSEENIERLCKLQKRAARIILGTDYLTPSAQMFSELRWPSIKNRHNYNKAALTYKTLNSLKPRLYAQFAPWCKFTPQFAPWCKFTPGCKIAPGSKFATPYVAFICQ